MRFVLLYRGAGIFVSFCRMRGLMGRNKSQGAIHAKFAGK